MSSWYSNILTNTSSRISNLRSTLLGGDADGDTEDDTHVCRVLRAYYTENGRSFPSWLPPDPKAPPPPVATPVYNQSSVGSRYGAGLTSSQSASGAVGGGGLSSLWDNNNSGANTPLSATSSLRQGRLGGGRASPFTNNSNNSAADVVHARPLPSQRMGSYQSTQSAPSVSGGGGGSAQGKLRNLFGAAGASPGAGRTPSPAQAAATPPPPAVHGGGGGGGGNRPFMAYNASRTGGGDKYHQYGGGGGGGHPPGGQHGGRRPPIGGGLPSGPRMR